MRLSHLSIPLLLLVLSTPVRAESDPLESRLAALVVPHGLTAVAAAARAVEVDPTTRKKVAVIRERQANVTSAELARVPQVSASFGYTRLSEVDMPELAPGVTIPQVLDTFSTRLELAIPLSDYFLRFPALVESSELRVDAARVDVEAAEQQAMARAMTAYWQWVRAELRVVVSEQSLTQVKTTLVQMQARVEAQRASRADLLRLQSQVAEVERALFSAKGRADIALRTLRQLIGARADEVFSVGEDVFALPALPDLDLSVEARRVAAMSQRSEVKALDKAIAALSKSKDATRANLYPRVDVFASANYDNPNSRVFLGGDRFDLTWMAGLKVSWKLNDMLGVEASIEATDAQLAALREDRETLSRQLELSLADILNNVRVALVTRQTAATAKASAEESHRIRLALLASDRATAVELVDAETELTRTRIQEIDALIDLRVALIDLHFALGSPSDPH